jgi:hypothetical protein
VAIARKLLIAVWYVLQGKTDKYAEPEAVAQKMLRFAYTVGKANRPKGQTARNLRASVWMPWGWEVN